MNVFIEKEARVEVTSPCGVIEAIALAPASSGPLIDKQLLGVVCHPHPLHGGTMDNKVVTILARAFGELGIPAVRFNFRGVGSSQGQFDNAVGEVDDLLAVIQWGERQLRGRQLVLAGFSFGSSVAAQGSFRVKNLGQLTLVAPPVGHYPFDRNGRFSAPLCVILGGRDELADVKETEHWVAGIKSPVDLVRDDEACHFFHGRLMPLKRRLKDVLLQRLA